MSEQALIDYANNMQAAWTSYLAMLARVDEEMRELQSVEPRFTSTTGYTYGSCFEVTSNEQKAAEEIIMRIVNVAQDCLAGPGMKLEIDQQPYINRFIYGMKDGMEFSQRTRWEKNKDDFSPAKVGESLIQSYGGDKAKQVAYTQAADSIARAFSLHNNEEMKQIGGAIELSKHIYSEKDFSGKIRKIHYNYERDLHELFTAFRTFFRWAGCETNDFNELNEIEALIRTACNYSEGFNSRDAAGGKTLRVILFNSDIKVRLKIDLAGQLNEFISEYSLWLQDRMAA